ncbi:MAG: ATP synthase F1 subunit gamma [Polyangiaceae bacterium]
MPSLKAVRKRIGSVKNTQKITRAMKMVAGARLSRAQARITALRPYAVKTGDMLRNVANAAILDKEDKEASAEAVSVPLHPLLVVRPEKRVLYIVLSSDRGLCGAFNANVSRAAERAWKEKEAEGATVSFATVGRKARDYLARRKATIAIDFPGMADGLDLAKVKTLSDWIVPRLRGDNAEFDAIYVIYNEFKSAITQLTVTEALLPLKTKPSENEAAKSEANALSSNFEYEPSRDILLDRLVPMYLDITLYRALLESQASEFGARMSAMDAATRNAKEVIEKLTLVYNRARQAGITKELVEIVSGAEALKE